MLQIKDNYKFFVTPLTEMCSLFLYPVESELCNWIYDCSIEYWKLLCASFQETVLCLLKI